MGEINQFLAAYGGLILFVTVFAEQSGLPIPAAPWLLAAGALAVGGHINLFTAIGVSAVAALAADVTWFYIGQRGKGWVFKLFPRLRTVQRAGTEKRAVCSIVRGLRILTAAKFLPFGTIVPLRAGALNVSRVRFVIWDAVSSIIYAGVYVFAGFIFHNQVEQVMALIHRLGVLAFVLLIVFVGGYVGFEWLKRHRAKAAEAVESGTELEASHV